MVRKRRTAAEMEAAREAQRAEFGRKLETYRQNHSPEECSCAEKDADGGADPAIFDTSRTKNAAVEMKRSQKQAGCTEYIWRTARDEDVCPRCAANADKVFRYDSPPPGGHPGMVAGCRCYPEPIVPGVGRKPANTRAKAKASRFAKILWICIGVVILLLLAGKK